MTRTANEQAEKPNEQLCLRTARALFEELTSPDSSRRLAALQAVQLSPTAALRFGLHERRDVVDILLLQASRFYGDPEWFSWIGALASFRDLRVVQLFSSLLTTEEQGELCFALVEYLQTESWGNPRSQFAAALMQNKSAVRARAVACLLAGAANLTTAEQLRVGLLEKDQNSSLPLFQAAPSEWLAELAGPFQIEARYALAGQGTPALTSLSHHWDELSESTREWLVESYAECDEAALLEISRKALTANSHRVALAALKTLAGIDHVPAELNPLITPFLSHSDEAIRRAAVLSCFDVDWRLLFSHEASATVQQACIQKLAECEGLNAVPDLLQHLSSPDWRIRAAAAHALTSLGATGVRAALGLVPQGDGPVRTAIARMLVEFGDEELIDQFLACAATPYL
jgi:hypothetical protein